MKLIGSQRKELSNALLDAYPKPSKLDEMVSNELDKNLWAFAMGDDLKEIIFKLIRTAETEGWVKQLVEAAYRSNSGNETLKTFYQKYVQKQVEHIQIAAAPSQDKILENRSSEAQKVLRDESIKTAEAFRSSTTANEKVNIQRGATANGQKSKRQQQLRDEEMRDRHTNNTPYSNLGLIQRISFDSNITDLNNTPDQIKFEVYKRTLKQIHKMLRENLQTMSDATLMEFKEAIREIIDGFFDLRINLAASWPDLVHVMPILSRANSHLLTALSIHGTAKQAFEYYHHLQRCTDKIFEVIELLDA